MVTTVSSVKSSRSASSLSENRLATSLASASRLFRKLLGQSKRADHRQRVHTWLGLGPQHFRDDSLASLFRRREPQHLDYNLVVWPSPRRDPLQRCRARTRSHPPDKGLATAFEGTHECAGGPFQNFYNLPRGVLGAGCIADDSKEHLITRGRVGALSSRTKTSGLKRPSTACGRTKPCPAWVRRKTPLRVPRVSTGAKSVVAA